MRELSKQFKEISLFGKNIALYFRLKDAAPPPLHSEYRSLARSQEGDALLAGGIQVYSQGEKKRNVNYWAFHSTFTPCGRVFFFKQIKENPPLFFHLKPMNKPF